MATDAGSIWVRVRANTTGFKSEAESGVSKAGRDLGKLFAAAFAVGGAVEIVKGIAEATSSHQAAFAVLDRTVKNAGASNDLYGQSIEGLLEKEARLKGFSDEQLASAFSRLVSVTHDSKAAFKDLGEAEDLARFRHIDVAQAALALAKAEQGNANSLQRYGIQAVKVTTDTDRLKAAHDAASAAGAKFTAVQKAQYEAALKVAEAHDKQASASATLGLVEQRVGGSSAAFAKTAAGQWARLGQDVHQAKVAVGEEFVPALASAGEALGEEIQKVATSRQAHEDLAKAAHDIGTAFDILKSAVETIGPPLVTVVDHLGGFTTAIEALGAAIIAQNLYARLTAVATAETAAGTEAEAAATRVDLLKASLLRLAGIGLITIGVEILLNKKAVDKSVGDLLDKAHLGFLGGTAESQLSHADLLKPQVQAAIEHTFGPDVLQKILAKAGIAGQAVGKGFFDGFIQGVKNVVSDASAGVYPQIATAIQAAAAHAATDTKMQDAAKKAGAATVKALADSIKNDKTDLDQLNQNMADAITQGALAVNQAVDQAKQNLNTIGQDLATQITAIIDKPLTIAQQRLTNAQDIIAAEFDRRSAALQAKSAKLQRESDQLNLAGTQKNLRDLGRAVLLPGGRQLSTDPEKAIRQLERLAAHSPDSAALDQFIIQYRQAALSVQQGKLGIQTSALDARRQAEETALQLRGDALKLSQDLADDEKTYVQRRIADLTDEFNKHALTLGQFQKRVTNVLTAAGITRSRAIRELGVAGADQLAGDVQGLHGQAGAILAGPQRGGSGLAPTIVRPLQTLEQSQKQIAGIAKEQRDQQIKIAKEQAKYLKTLAGQKAADNFTGSLQHNPGDQTKKSKSLIGVSG